MSFYTQPNPNTPLNPPKFPGWAKKLIQRDGTVTKQQFEDAAIRYAEKGPRKGGER